MGIICCFNCGYSKQFNNRKIKRLQQELEYGTEKRIHKCKTDIYRPGGSNEPDLKFFVTDPTYNKLVYGSSYLYRGYCKNCLHKSDQYTEDEVKYWFYFEHLRSTFGIRNECKPYHYGITELAPDYRTRHQEAEYLEEDRKYEYMQDYGITEDDLSKETRVEEGNEEIAAWLRVDPGRDNAIEIYNAKELLHGECPICNFSFTFDEDIKKKVANGYDEFYQLQFRVRSEQERWNEYIHTRFTTLNSHFKEFHFYQFANDPDLLIPKQVNILLGMLQQLVIYENALKMEYELKNSSRREKTRWKREHDNKSLVKRYYEFNMKRASVTQKLYKDYLLPTRMISLLLLDNDSHVREQGFRGMIANDAIPEWLVNVVNNVEPIIK